MASHDYSKNAATALKGLAKFGKSVVLVRVTGETYDPVTGATVSGSDASVTTTGMLTNYTDSQIDEVRILTGDRKLILSNEHEPLASDKVTISGENWSIVSIKALNFDDESPVIFYVQVRK